MVDSNATKANINVRSASYRIAHAISECGRCGAGIQLVAIALPPQHESLVLDWDVDADESIDYRWERVEWSALLFYLEYLPEEIRRRLQSASPGFRFAFSELAQKSYWANHCTSCHALIEDHDLFCEPDGAFVPTTATRAATVTLERVDETLQAGAIGYAGDPQFLGPMIGS